MGDFYEMFYEDALVAARALDLTLTSRSKDGTGWRDPDVRRAPSCRGRLPRAARQERVPRRHLRSGRGPEEGQGDRPARGRPRRLAGHADRRPLSGRARAGVPDEPGAGGDRAGRPRRRRAARPVDRRVLRAPSMPAPKACRRWPTNWPCCSRAKSSCRRGSTWTALVPAARRRPPFPARASRGGPSSSSRRGARSSISSGPTGSKGSGSRRIRPPCARPARSCTTCATRRRPTSRTCAR